MVLIVLAILSGGCSRKKPEPPLDVVETPEVESSNTVMTQAGTGSRYGVAEGRQELWRVHWQSGRVTIFSKGGLAGTMQTVTGEIFQGGRVSTTFSSDTAVAERAGETLTLRGKVTVKSKTDPVTIYCDQLVYIPRLRSVRANGNVRIVTETGELRSTGDILANPDLSQIATPDRFEP